MINMLKQFGCIWVREIHETIVGKTFTIFLGYIVKENGAARPYIAAVKDSLSEVQRKHLRQQLSLSHQTVLGEYEEKWMWHTCDGEKLSSPPIVTSTKNIIEREADMNMIFLSLFASLKGLPPKIIRELVNAALLTRIHLHELNEQDDWLTMLQFPEKFTFYAMKALRTMNVEHIAFIPYINKDIVIKLINHITPLPIQSHQLAKSYLAFSMMALREEFSLTISPSYWVEEVLENMKDNNTLKGEVIDLSSIFSSKLIYCMNNDHITELIAIEESAHFVPQAKMFALLTGDSRIKIQEQWSEDLLADTVIAEITNDNIFRLTRETTQTLRPDGYGCWFMDAKLESLARTLLASDQSKFEIKEVFHYESQTLGNWSAIVFYKK